MSFTDLYNHSLWQPAPADGLPESVLICPLCRSLVARTDQQGHITWHTQQHATPEGGEQ